MNIEVLIQSDKTHINTESVISINQSLYTKSLLHLSTGYRYSVFCCPDTENIFFLVLIS